MQWWNDFWSTVGNRFGPEFWADFWGKLLAIIVIVLLAFALRWALHVVIDKVVRRIVSGVKKGQETDDTQVIAAASPLAAVRVVQRTRTLGSVLTNVVNVTIFIVAVLMIINTISPDVLGSFALLTAAIGAGLGFGAQNIVKDTFNGIFMVMEDQLGVGDVVDTGSATGVVEAVGIRVTQIRDVNGTLWYVRNGEILRVGNMSQGWARIVIDLAVPYDADLDAVQERILRTAEQLATAPKWRSLVLERPEVWGLESISADALVVRLVMKVRTSARDDVGRELRMRLKRALDEMDVKLPALNSVVLAGFDGAASVRGARAPKTKPTPVPENTAPRLARKVRAPRKPSQ
ncbi:mechanosensitive ion channel domain-containing protein [Rathayibacter sp. YIM 133350]|uniref:mechanosensitive ion channel family protein n=1 Tax=Rathayibacter sp. YIM 133350 TaxID=3131992 RepID=UPI00307DF802